MSGPGGADRVKEPDTTGLFSPFMPSQLIPFSRSLQESIWATAFGELFPCLASHRHFPACMPLPAAFVRGQVSAQGKAGVSRVCSHPSSIFMSPKMPLRCSLEEAVVRCTRMHFTKHLKVCSGHAGCCGQHASASFCLPPPFFVSHPTTKG